MNQRKKAELATITGAVVQTPGAKSAATNNERQFASKRKEQAEEPLYLNRV